MNIIIFEFIQEDTLVNFMLLFIILMISKILFLNFKALATLNPVKLLE